MTETTALHAMSTNDLIDILCNDSFSTEEKIIACGIAKDRFWRLQTKLHNVSHLIGVTND